MSQLVITPHSATRSRPRLMTRAETGMRTGKKGPIKYKVPTKNRLEEQVGLISYSHRLTYWTATEHRIWAVVRQPRKVSEDQDQYWTSLLETNYDSWPSYEVCVVTSTDSLDWYTPLLGTG